MSDRKTFTGRDRQRRTRWGVRAMDVVSKSVITVGGIGTIVAILLVGVSLVAVAAPLFSSAEIEPAGEFRPDWPEPPVAFHIDEYQVLGWAVFSDGTLRLFRADDGATLRSQSLAKERPAVVAASPDQNTVVLGFEDGGVQFCRIALETDFVRDDRLPDEVRGLPPGGRAVWNDGVVVKTPQGQFRRQSATVRVQPAQKVASSPIRALEFHPRGSSDGGPVLAVATADGKLALAEFRTRKNLINRTEEWKLEGQHAVPLDGDAAAAGRGPPAFVRLMGRGDNLYAAWPDGHAVRFNVRRPAEPRFVETIQFTDDGATLTVLQPILGRNTLIAGDSAGHLSGWFLVRRTDDAGRERSVLVRTKRLPATPSAVAALSSSRRTRLVAAGYEDGRVRLFHVTSEDALAEVRAPAGPVTSLVISPKDDGLYAVAGGVISRWRVDPKHPEASLASLFGKVWYEGYDQPEHVWQSTAASVDVELKFGVTPLIFGTLKATFYAMLFATPLALLAAVYTSEFLGRGTRAKLKPAIETMASLPSVVLGFLAALVFAPFVYDHVTAVLASLVILPVTILSGAFAWQLLPSGVSVRFAHLRLLAVAALIPLGLFLSWRLGPVLQRLLFGGSFVRWLDGLRTEETFGSPVAGWLFLCLPLSALIVGLALNRIATPAIIRRFGRGDRARFALMELGKFTLAIVATALLDLLLSLFLSALGLDPRSGLVGTYQQRNAMIVGFVMGFAVIPIVYTIADDALTSVPESLRSASLGAGATPWQTAVRVVVPTAMSGLFSALMIGLGRAVGETMIVVMATGNTAVMDVNPFNGLRTLSANIAVEIPDAARGTTHFRILFFCGLALFAMTFVVNTLAEIVRLRFRRRVYQL